MRLLVTGGSGFIGTNLVDAMVARGIEVLNLDFTAPLKQEHTALWQQCSILDARRVQHAFASFRPAQVIHMAGRTNPSGRTLEAYRANTEGTAIALAAIAQTPSVERAIVISTQCVFHRAGLPSHDEDFDPYSAYGQSKVIAEQLTRRAKLQCVWTIIRPTNVWGPWHPRYPHEFWKAVGRGWYVHPGRAPVVRSLAYVGNVVHQICGVLGCPAARVDQRVLYVGDPPMDIYHWANGFSLQQRGHPVRVGPTWVVKGAALLGECLLRLRIPFPLTLSRYRSMTTSNDVPMDSIHDLCGESPYTLEAAIAETVKWLRVQHPSLVRI